MNLRSTILAGGVSLFLTIGAQGQILSYDNTGPGVATGSGGAVANLASGSSEIRYFATQILPTQGGLLSELNIFASYITPVGSSANVYFAADSGGVPGSSPILLGSIVPTVALGNTPAPIHLGSLLANPEVVTGTPAWIFLVPGSGASSIGWNFAGVNQLGNGAIATNAASPQLATWDPATRGGGIQVYVQAVPEPGTIALGMIGLVLVGQQMLRRFCRSLPRLTSE